MQDIDKPLKIQINKSDKNSNSKFVLHNWSMQNGNFVGINVMTWARDLLRDAAYSLHPSHFQCNLILTKSTNSAHLFKRYHPQTCWACAYEDC